MTTCTDSTGKKRRLPTDESQSQEIRLSHIVSPHLKVWYTSNERLREDKMDEWMALPLLQEDENEWNQRRIVMVHVPSMKEYVDRYERKMKEKEEEKKIELREEGEVTGSDNILHENSSVSQRDFPSMTEDVDLHYGTTALSSPNPHSVLDNDMIASFLSPLPPIVNDGRFIAMPSPCNGRPPSLLSLNLSSPFPPPINRSIPPPPSCLSPCPKCGLKIELFCDMKVHLSENMCQSVSASICRVCGKRLSSKWSLTKHIERHNKRGRCHFCSASFEDCDDLRDHALLTGHTHKYDKDGKEIEEEHMDKKKTKKRERRQKKEMLCVKKEVEEMEDTHGTYA